MIFKKKKSSPKIDLSDLSPRLRGFLLDSQVEHPHEIAELLGLTAISDEVADREEEESDKRVEKLAMLIPVIYAYAKIVSEGSMAYQRAVFKDDLSEFPEELFDHSSKMIEQLAFSTAVGTISQLADMGVINLPEKKRKK